MMMSLSLSLLLVLTYGSLGVSPHDDVIELLLLKFYLVYK
jgi:hypothetical protein